MNKEFCILLIALLLTGFGTAVIIANHTDSGRKDPYGDVQHVVFLELRTKALRFFRQRDLFEAENHLRKLLKMNPENREMMLLYGRVLLETGRSEEAERVFRRLAASNPLDYGARNNIGVVMLLAHRYEDAQREFELISRKVSARQYVSVNLESVKAAIELSRTDKKFAILLNSDNSQGTDDGVITTSITQLQEKQ